MATSRTRSTAKPAQPPKSNKDQVKSEFKDAKAEEMKNGFVIMSSGGITKRPLHSGIAKSESDAWKLAAHAIL